MTFPVAGEGVLSLVLGTEEKTLDDLMNLPKINY